jgi:hypothetical protein
MAAALAAEPGVELVCEVGLNQFMVRFGDDDAATLATVERIQADAVAFIGAATWRDRWVMRVSVSAATTEKDGEITVAATLDHTLGTQAGPLSKCLTSP